MEHSENDAANSLKKAVKQGTVIQKERTKSFVNGKNKVFMGTINEFKGHFSRAFNIVFVTTGRQNLECQQKGINLSSPQFGQPYMAPP